jgi:hypothetical protein
MVRISQNLKRDRFEQKLVFFQGILLLNTLRDVCCNLYSTQNTKMCKMAKSRFSHDFGLFE